MKGREAEWRVAEWPTVELIVMNHCDILPGLAAGWADDDQYLHHMARVVLLLHFTMSSSRLETSAGLSAPATVKVI